MRKLVTFILTSLVVAALTVHVGAYRNTSGGHGDPSNGQLIADGALPPHVPPEGQVFKP